MAEHDNVPFSSPPFDRLPVELHLRFGFYLDDKDLYKAVRVNKRWFDRLIDPPWREPPMKALEHLNHLKGSGDPESADDDEVSQKGENRCHFYSKKIRILRLNDKDDSWCKEHTAFQRITFTSLRHLEIDCREPGFRWYEPFLNPNLHTLVVSGCHLFTPAVLEMELPRL